MQLQLTHPHLYLLIFNVILSIVLVVLPIQTNGPWSDATSYSPHLPSIAGYLTLVISFIPLILLKFMRNAQEDVVFASSFVHIWIDFANLAWGSIGRFIIVWFLLIYHFMLLIDAIGVRILTAKWRVSAYSLSVPPVSADSSDQELDEIEHLNESDLDEGSKVSVEKRYNHQFTLLVLLVSIGFCVFVGSEFYILFSAQPPLLSPVETAALKQISDDRWADIPKNMSTRVVMVIWDGLRFDKLMASSAFENMTKSAFLPDLRVTMGRACFPTISRPNYYALLTGAPPEFSGRLSNAGSISLEYESGFEWAQKAGLKRGIAAGWLYLLEPYLEGLGAYAIGSSDAQRGKWLVDALVTPYRLFLSYFGNIDKKGHEYGVSSRWDPMHHYEEAVDVEIGLFHHALEFADNNTIVIGTADHGHIDRGGHGGDRDVLRDVPIVLFKKDSLLHSANAPSTMKFDRTIRDGGMGTENSTGTIDIPTTISALLGLPIPAESLGLLIEEALVVCMTQSEIRTAYRDLYRQKLALINAIRNKTVDSLISNKDIGGDQSIEWYRDSIDQLMVTYYQTRERSLQSNLTRNLLISSVFVVFVLCLLFWMGKQEGKEFGSFAVAFSLVVGYLIMTTSVYVIAAASDGVLAHMDITTMHAAYHGVTFALTSFLPGILISIGMTIWIRRRPKKSMLWWWISAVVVVVYCCHHLVWGLFSFSCPLGFRISWVAKNLVDIRFRCAIIIIVFTKSNRILIMGLMLVPLSFTIMIAMIRTLLVKS